MRRIVAATLVSVASHAVAMGWLAGGGRALVAPPRRPSSPAAPPGLTIADADAEQEVALVLLDAQGAPAASPPAMAPLAPHADGVHGARPSPTAAGRDRRGETALAIDAAGRDRTAAATEASGRHGETSAAPARSPWLIMRGPAPPEIHGPSQGFIDAFLARTRPLAPRPDTPERLTEQRDEARRDHRSVAEIVALDDQIAQQELRPSGDGTYRAEDQTFIARVDADGTTHLEDKPRQLDTQDSVMLHFGIDPYARDKLDLLDRTRDQRVALGERYRTSQLAHSAERMLRSIDRLWGMAPDLAARKRGLFELWDDCAETGSDELVAGADAARRLVVGAIRARLRGADAYTAAELAALNAIRHSTAVFAPYE